MDKLFEKFERTSTKDLWRSEVEKDLKGKPLEKLFWKTYEGFTLENFYKREDLETVNHLGTTPGKAPYLRGSKPLEKKNDWLICQEISNVDVKDVNFFIKRNLDKGVQSITLNFDNRIKRATLDCCNCVSGINFKNYDQFKSIFEGIDLKTVVVNFNSGRFSTEIFSYLKRYATEMGLSLNDLKGSIDNEPIRELSFIGEIKDLEERFEKAAELINEMKGNSEFKGLNICLNKYHEAGANSSQEIAFALATFAEYADRFEGKVDIKDLLNTTKFTFSTGQYYLTEIAKYRAFRYLFNKVVEKMTGSKEDGKTFIHAQTSRFTMSKFDPNVNMLRGTTQAMSAALGGVDELTVIPFDIVTDEPAEFSYRIAKNIQLMMKEECHFDHIVDPAGGSYFIEITTAKIIEESWKLFMEIVDNGGMVASIRDGKIKTMVNEIAEKRRKSIGSRKDIFVGTNQYPNILELLEKKESRSFVYSQDDEVVTLSKNYTFEPSENTLKPFRITEVFEDIRLATEAHTEKSGKRVTAFMATIGNLGMRKARATFSSGFLGAAGFDIIDNNGFATSEEAFKAFKESGAEIIVICSSDDEYATYGAEIAKMVKEDNSSRYIIVAGYPKELLETLKEAGVNEFIHVRANAKDVLTQIQNCIF